ncbi:hypothetical protein GCG54_00003148 [Colletotrichum gloeosporioides]|uniref:Uncharacterized protein n=1 Tax=Colletotrichum gloeosporioides TaxID=474922 RepID=A0A8H4CVL2_COLGL|nr:uncharacterized protein GCG54_00003148 [Colletotrichum gloeosporioides]KAF3810969.1 hypothetical protein GCG54_00003148 [Colletotrichum gloeosporioides]
MGRSVMLTLVAFSSATTSPQVEEAAPVPGGTPQAKRMMKRTRQMAPMARLPFTPTKRAKSVATGSGTNDTPSYEEARENVRQAASYILRTT